MVGNYSHLFTVPGREPDLEPYMLLAHIDVLLKCRGVKLQYVLDEGLTIMDGVVDGLIGPGALWDLRFTALIWSFRYWSSV